MDWLKRLFTRRPAPLTGAPAVRRQKTYSAESGYVYQYYYLGHRPASAAGAPAAEFVFEVTADRRSWFPVSVMLGQNDVAAWQRAHARSLDATEQYAIAKMALFGAFDDRETPEAMQAAVRVGADRIEAILAALKID